VSGEVILKPGREKALKNHHPWIFSGAIAKVTGNPVPGSTVSVLSSKNELLGIGAYSPESSIRVRMWSFGSAPVTVDQEFLYQRMQTAFNLRERIGYLDDRNTACRLIYAESDGLPGLIADRYNDFFVVQFLTAGAEYWRDAIIENLQTLSGVENIYERSDVDVRALEGLPKRTGVLTGDEPPAEGLQIQEDCLTFTVDVAAGQKTGFYLDQRLNRRAVKKYVQGKTVLNCFSYTGAFSVYALKAEAKKVINIDSSAGANETAGLNLKLNQVNLDRCQFITADVFKELRTMRDKGLGFDVVILDPPKFAPTSAQINAAARGYKDINLLAMKLLNPGGTLLTFSCSGGLDRKLFQKILADAALDADADMTIVEQLSQGPDHPIALNFPEGEYLKGFVCQIN